MPFYNRVYNKTFGFENFYNYFFCKFPKISLYLPTFGLNGYVDYTNDMAS